MRSRANFGGGSRRIEQQHARDNFTARERLSLLLDEGSFQEFGALATHQFSAFGLDKQRFPAMASSPASARSAAAAWRCLRRTSPCWAVHSPTLTDFIIMAGNSTMFPTGPDVIKAAIGEVVSAQAPGGADVHMARRGVAHLAADTQVAGPALTQLLLSCLRGVLLALMGAGGH